jgi:hypothetical protein
MVILKWQSIVISLLKLKIAWCLIKLKIPYGKIDFRELFNIHVKTKKIEIPQKMIMIWTNENMAQNGPFKSS